MTHEVWELQGRVKQTIYSPRGGVEGFLLDVGGVTVQFVCHGHDLACSTLAPRQAIVARGTVRPPSDKGESEHEVYDLVDLPGVQGPDEAIEGKIVRFNYAKHGAPNGVILDSGHFVHTKPDGLRRLGWKIGQQVALEGHSMQPLWDQRGFVVEIEP